MKNNFLQTQMEGATVDQKTNVIYKSGKDIGVMVNGTPFEGFPTPSKKNEFYSQTMVDWKWPEYAIPTYIKSHIHPEKLDKEKGEYVSGSYFPFTNLDSLTIRKCKMAD